MKIAIVVGHNARAQGAVRATDGVSEFVWNSHLADLIRDHDPMNVRIFHRTYGGGYSLEIDRVYADVDAWRADCSVELHFNAAAASSAAGCLTLSSGTSGSLRLAGAIQRRTLAVLGNRDRGIDKVSRTDRGGRSLWQGRAPAVLTEPYFGSNAEECIVADRNKGKLAGAIYEACCEVAR
ncbi:MAG: N-acetylmuramoyl-L-alanine amidase [Celeribacter sp.]|jgi:N-acetylmuramoyl-L-alanine amidase